MPRMISMKLKENLKALMEANGITLTELSKRTNVPKQTIHNWLCGTEPKSLNQIRAIATFFKLSIEELCYGDEKKKTQKKHEPNPIEEHEDEIRAGVFEVVLRRIKK